MGNYCINKPKPILPPPLDDSKGRSISYPSNPENPPNISIANTQSSLIRDRFPQQMNDNIKKMIRNKEKLIKQGIVSTFHGKSKQDWVPSIINPDLIYQGQWSEDNNWHGVGLLYNKSKKWLVVGSFFNNKLIPNRCRKIFDNKVEYLGSLNQEYELHGSGKITGKTFIYEGNFKKDYFDGKGKLQRSGIIFTGEFKNSRKVFGKEVTSKGIYEGPYIDEKKSGNGTFIWNEGGKYIGKFFNDKIHGEGKLYDTQGCYCGTHSFEYGKFLM